MTDTSTDVSRETPSAGAAKATGAEADTDALFAQSEIAADYVEGLLDILDTDGDIDELVRDDRPIVEVVGAGLKQLVGPGGATLEALQELTRLAIFRKTGEHSRLMLDIGGFRATRRQELQALAKKVADEVAQYGNPVRLDPMNAFERKCVHDVINARKDVVSESEGTEPARRVIVSPA